MRPDRLLLCLVALLLMPTQAARAMVVAAGEVVALDAQPILTPPSDSSPVVLRFFAPEGRRVRTGDKVLAIDGGQASSALRQTESDRARAAARAEKEIAGLEVAAADAERRLRAAEAKSAKADLDAAIPREHLAALDADRYAGDAERARREVAVEGAAWQAALAAVERRQRDAALELADLDTKIAHWRALQATAEIHAEIDGFVVHGFDPWRGNRFDEGSSSYPGQRVGDIVPKGAVRLAARAFVLESDRTAFAEDTAVWMSFDALPGHLVEARIERIGGAPEAKAEWGEGRYYRMDIAFAADAKLVLRPGSSVRVHSEQPVAPPVASAIASGPLRFEGEVVALGAATIAPPSIENIWQMTITKLTPDGTAVKAGDVVAAFDANELMRQLAEKQGQLAEKRSQRERMVLDHEERERAENLATAEQRAALEKARRKADQPAELYAAMAWKKLVIEREQAEAEMSIVARREALATRQRQAERAELEAELALLEADVASLTAGLAALEVRAPRDGVMQHLSNFQGEKFAVGSPVFRGLAVAQIPDLEQLAINLQVPERRIGLIERGARVSIQLEGGARRVLNGRIGNIGGAVRSRSRANPVPVVDVEVSIDSVPEGIRLKPGLPVRVEVLP